MTKLNYGLMHLKYSILNSELKKIYDNAFQKGEQKHFTRRGNEGEI